MPFHTIRKKYENQLITQVLIKENCVTLYFGDLSQKLNDLPPEHFARELNTCILFETNKGTWCAYYDAVREKFFRVDDLSEIERKMEGKSIFVVNQHSAATYSRYHDVSFFDCCFSPQKINHLHFKITGQMTSQDIEQILKVADAYQGKQESFHDVITAYKDKYENIESPLLMERSFERSQCRIL